MVAMTASCMLTVQHDSEDTLLVIQVLLQRAVLQGNSRAGGV